jgi:uncharacterized protein YjbI with pentapeptide repeats
VGIVALGVGFFVVFVVFVLKWAPELLASDGLKGKDRAEDVGRSRTALLASLAGLIAVAGAVFTGLSYRLNRAGQITERFTRAIDQLGHSELDVRLGGIYALERIARDSKDDHPQVVEVLTAYVREHAPWPARTSGRPAGAAELDVQIEAIHALIAATRALARNAAGSEAEPDVAGVEVPDEPPPSGDQTERAELPTDVQATMRVLGRRDASQDRAGTRFNLARTDLRRVVLEAPEANLQAANLSEANLQAANLSEANLQSANLSGANLEGARLPKANLEGARLSGANLEGAYLPKANLQGARLFGANLEGADLPKANLQGARLRGANLQGADLGEANLQGANLRNANLQRANLRNANLQGASPDGANLQRASLREAKLQGASLERANLEGANLERANLEGANLERANLEGANLERAGYDASTRWPTADFDAYARGARLHVGGT